MDSNTSRRKNNLIMFSMLFDIDFHNKLNFVTSIRHVTKRSFIIAAIEEKIAREQEDTKNALAAQAESLL